MKEEISIKEGQQIALNILKVVHQICIDKGLRYCLIYGTLLGAIRHKGFIPWDDDLDIMMPRKDYEQFVKIWNEIHFDNLELFSPENSEKYPYMISRISDNRFYIEMDNEDSYGMGVFIDIYPFDGLGNTREEALQLGLKGDRWSSLYYQSTRQKCKIENTKSKIRILIKYPTYMFSKILGRKFLKNKLSKLANLKKYEESEYVGCVTWLSGGEKDIFLREWFDQLITVPFEDSEFMIPQKYEPILSKVYGDYMQLPPENERKAHHGYKIYMSE